MATFNLSSMADRVRYLESQGKSRQEAEQQVFGDMEMSQEMQAEYERLYNDEQAQSTLNKEDNIEGDKDRIINRNQAGRYETYDTSAQNTAVSTQDQTATE